MTSNNKCNPCRCGEAEGEPLKGQMAVVDRDGRENASKCQELGQVPIRQVPVSEVRPSPENDTLYRPVDPNDPDIVDLGKSIRHLGVREPLVLTRDGYILSGHRRYAAARLAGLETVPCRTENVFRVNEVGEVNEHFVSMLREHNRQRVKTFAEKLREEAVTANPEIAYQSLIEHRQRRSQLDLETLHIRGEKRRSRITKAKWPFLEAIKAIIADREEFWPLSDRQIHYALLNDPPLIHAAKPDTLYHNDAKCYKALTELLTRARIVGDISMRVIQDATRPVTLWGVHRDVQAYIRKELSRFGTGYWRDLMQSQPNHIEIVGEKNTIEPIIRPVAEQFCIPMTIGRGYCSLRPRYDIAERFRISGKERLVLLMLSDHDPDGEEIAHSLARSLRDDFLIDEIEPVKVALTADQVAELDLPPTLKAKRKSSNYQRFANKHGDYVWELEALPPRTLQVVLQDAIDTVIDVGTFNHEIDQEKADAAKLEGVRGVVLEALKGWDEEDEANE